MQTQTKTLTTLHQLFTARMSRFVAANRKSAVPEFAAETERKTGAIQAAHAWRTDIDIRLAAKDARQAPAAYNVSAIDVLSSAGVCPAPKYSTLPSTAQTRSAICPGGSGKRR